LVVGIELEFELDVEIDFGMVENFVEIVPFVGESVETVEMVVVVEDVVLVFDTLVYDFDLIFDCDDEIVGVSEVLAFGNCVVEVVEVVVHEAVDEVVVAFVGEIFAVGDVFVGVLGSVLGGGTGGIVGGTVGVNVD
jgi:hypothetical protein